MTREWQSPWLADRTFTNWNSPTIVIGENSPKWRSDDTACNLIHRSRSAGGDGRGVLQHPLQSSVPCFICPVQRLHRNFVGFSFALLFPYHIFSNSNASTLLYLFIRAAGDMMSLLYGGANREKSEAEVDTVSALSSVQISWYGVIMRLKVGLCMLVSLMVRIMRCTSL